MECKVIFVREGKNYVETREYEHALLENEEIAWIHFYLQSRSEISEITSGHWVSDGLLKRLQEPGVSFNLERFGQAKLLDCNVSYEMDDPQEHYLTFVLLPNIVVTVTTFKSKLKDYITPEELVEREVFDFRNIVLSLFRRLVDRNTSLASDLSKKVDSILKETIQASFHIRTTEIEELHTKAIDLGELFEDQLATVRLLPINIENRDQQDVALLERIEKSLEHLVNIIDRSQEKLDYILQRYSNELQKKGNARLNTLTIIQAIFVPLTFIAGIYGMNFVNMPELQWPNGYYYVWILMGIIGFGSLYLFYRNGWFK